MRQIFRFNLVLPAACLFVGMVSTLLAQQGKKPSPPPAGKQPAGAKPAGSKASAESPPVRQFADERKERPAVNDLVIDKLSPELEQILAKWEIESAKIKSLIGKHRRSEFNSTFGVEKVSVGRFFLETPDKGRIDITARVPNGAEVSTRVDEFGKRFVVEKGASMRWICTGEEIFEFDEDEKTYSREEIPEEMRGKNIVHSPLPFLFGMKAAEAKRRFNMSLQTSSKDSPNTVRLKAIPQMDSDRQNYREAWIILDTKKYIPTYVRLFDPHGLETVYAFEHVTINDSKFKQGIVEAFRGDPYKPSIKGYTRVISNEVEPASSRAADGRNLTRPAGGAPPSRREGLENSAMRSPPARATGSSSPATKK